MPNWKKVIVSGSDAILNNITASGNVSGSTISTASFGTYIGDGSQLSGISTTPFPFTGDAQISGSLIISQSYTAGDTDSTALRLIGSGSVSESGIFEVEGSAGPLFSVQDGLDGVLMEVNNISGLPLFQVSSSNEVFINRGNLTSGVTTATASFAHFTGSFQGDGSNLTNLNTTTPTLAQVVTAGASAAGDVSITGSLTITGSLISVGIQKQADVTNTVMGPGAGGTSMDWNGTSAFGENILIGSGSGKSLTISKQNTFIGNLTGTSAGASVNYNTLVGYKAGNRLYVGGYNTFVGTTAGGAALINGGNFNTFLGYGAGDNITSGDSNVFLGASAGALIQEGSNNIGIGHEALYNSDTSGNNIAIGTSALRLLDVAGSSNTATDNIAIGHNSAASLTSGTKNIIIGSGSLAADNPSNQIRIGHADLHIISGSLTTGDVIFYNTASAPNFSGSFQGDGSNLTNLPAGTTPTLQQVVTQGSFTTIPITASILSATASNAYNVNADSLTVKGGDGIFAGGSNGGNLNLQGGNSSGASGTRKGGNVIIRGGEGPTSSGSISITGDTSITGSFIIEKSGSTVFEVIGSEGTLFSIDDDLDGVIFTANDRSGLPVLEASASGEVYIGKAPQSLYTTAVISSTTAATTQSIYGLSTSSYGGAFFDYTVQSGSDARAGSIMSVWNGGNISFTETTTTDIGDTTDFNVIVHISQSQAQIASHATRAGYNIKTIIRSI